MHHGVRLGDRVLITQMRLVAHAQAKLATLQSFCIWHGYWTFYNDGLDQTKPTGAVAAREQLSNTT